MSPAAAEQKQANYDKISLDECSSPAQHICSVPKVTPTAAVDDTEHSEHLSQRQVTDSRLQMGFTQADTVTSRSSPRLW